MQGQPPHTRSLDMRPEDEAIFLREYEGLVRSRRMANSRSQFNGISARAPQEVRDASIQRNNTRQTVSGPRRTMKAARMRKGNAAPYVNGHERTPPLSDDVWIGLLFGEDDNHPVNALNRLGLRDAGPEHESPQLPGNDFDEQCRFEKFDPAAEGSTEEYTSASARQQSSLDQSAHAAPTEGEETNVLCTEASNG